MNRAADFRSRPARTLWRGALSWAIGSALALSAGCSGGGGGGGSGPNPPPVLNSNAELSALALSLGSITFDPDVTAYALAVDFPDTQLQVTATLADPAATVVVAGVTVASGAAHDVDLEQGANLIEVVVTAEDGATTRTYELDVFRELGNDDAALSDLALSVGTLVFDPDVTFYDVDVGFFDTQELITPTLSDPAATVTVAGVPVASGSTHPVPLAQGSNLIAVVVTAQDGSTTRTYELDILRESGSSNAELSGLTLSAGTIAFDPDVTSYNFAVTYLVAHLIVTPTAAHPLATLTVAGTPVDSGSAHVLDLSEGSNLINVVVSAADGVTTRTYTLGIFRQNVGTFAQKAYAKASNTGSDDLFGFSVAFHRDTLAVGAFGEDSNATGIGGDETDNSAASSGAVYVFKRDAGVWSQQAYLKASNTQGGDQFGRRIALDGDTLAVGAFGEDSSATGVNGDESDNLAQDSGAVYVFTRSAGVWSQQAYLKASNTDAGDEFGFSLALDGDTLAVGAHFEDSLATGIDGDEVDDSAGNSGAVYVFTRDAGAWSQQAYVKASNTDAADSFGQSVALSGDTLAVGALGESSSASGVDGDQADNSAGLSGAAYVFTRDAGAWSQQAYIKASNPDPLDVFGAAVALDGSTLAVGARFEDSNVVGIDGNQASNAASSSGAVYVFTRDTGAWSQEAYIKATNTRADDAFGTSLALDGNTLAVGAIGEDSSATGINGPQFNDSVSGSGAVYVLIRKAGVWSHKAYVKASNTAVDDQFGIAVALDRGALAVGAHVEDSNATGIGGLQSDNSAADSGAAYVFN